MKSQSLGVCAVALALAIPLHTRADVTFTDSAGLEYLVRTDVTFTTTSSASGAASEASFVAAVPATTMAGGTTSLALSDMFDGYGALAISFEATAPTTQPFYDDAAFVYYNDNGAAVLDSACGNRQAILPTTSLAGTGGSVDVHRRVFVPANDAFIRWISVFRNPGSSPVTFHVGHAGNMGSDDSTLIVTSSDDDAVAELTDTWVTTMEAFSGTTSSDPRVGHVMQGEGTVRAPLARIDFANADETPFWWYTLTLAAGETASIVTFATGQPSRAAAAAKAEELGSMANDNMFDCMSLADLAVVANFRVQCVQPGDEGDACDDNDLCTEDDECSSGECVGTPKACRSSASDCTGVCDPLTGTCEEDNVPNATLCDDGDACDGSGSCQAGVCTPGGVAPDCNDRNPCTADSCNAATGCVNAMMSGCLACGTGEDAGADDEDGGEVFPACDDDNVCNGAESCGPDDTCMAGTALDCDDGDPCTADTCDADDGCDNEVIASCMACDDDGDCDDGNLCDGDETCDEGVCVAQDEALDCDDGDACTTDSCVPATGCEHVAISTGTCGPGPDAGMPTGGSPSGGSGGASGSSGMGAGSGGMAGSDVDGGAGSGGSSDGGCDCSTLGSGSASTAGLWMLALALIGLRRRRS